MATNDSKLVESEIPASNNLSTNDAVDASLNQSSLNTSVPLSSSISPTNTNDNNNTNLDTQTTTSINDENKNESTVDTNSINNVNKDIVSEKELADSNSTTTTTTKISPSPPPQQLSTDSDTTATTSTSSTDSKSAPTTTTNSTTSSTNSNNKFFKFVKRKLSRANNTPPPPTKSFKVLPSNNNNTKTTATTPPTKSTTPPPSAEDKKKKQEIAESDPMHDCSFKVAVSEDYNLKYRHSMEDAHVYIYNYCDVRDAGYFAVFDGHAGAHAAKWCSENLHKLVQTWILRHEGLLPMPAEKSKSKNSSSTTTASENNTSTSSSSGSSLKPRNWFKRPSVSSVDTNASNNNNNSTPDVNNTSNDSVSSAASVTTAKPAQPVQPMRPDIPRNQIIPLAFNRAFIEADSKMMREIPSTSGTTAAVSVIRWETCPVKPGTTATAPNNTNKSPQESTTSISANNSNSPTNDDNSTLNHTADKLGNLSINSEASPTLAKTNSTSSSSVPGDSTSIKSSESQVPLKQATTNAEVPLQKTASRMSFTHSFQPPPNKNRVLYTANVGDARIVLCRQGKALRLSYDHKGSDKNESNRIKNSGGLIISNRVNGMLAVTRSLGDGYMKHLVTGSPFTTRTVLTPEDEFVIIACDGLWDVCTDQQAVDLVRDEPDPKLASKKLVESAIESFSSDNITCMVIRLDSAICEGNNGVQDPQVTQSSGMDTAFGTRGQMSAITPQEDDDCSAQATEEVVKSPTLECEDDAITPTSPPPQTLSEPQVNSDITPTPTNK